MKKILLATSLFLLVIKYPLTAQTSSADSVINQYQGFLAQMVLLQNTNGYLPLKRLDTLRIGGLGLWLQEQNTFFSIARRYVPFDTVDKPHKRQPSTLADTLAATYNLVIAAVDASVFSEDFVEAAGFTERLFLSLKGRCKVVLIVFGAGDFWRSLNVRQYADAIIYVPTIAPLAQSLAAQLVFGGVGASGRLSADLSDQFKSGEGQNSEGGLRLGYAPPEVMGFDAQRLRDSIQTIIGQGISEKAFPGAQIIVAKNGQVVWYEAFGNHTYETEHPVNMDDLYDLASITKISTSTLAAMYFYGNGLLHLDAPMADYYPPFKKSNKAGLTVRQMMAHNARLQAWIPFWRHTLKKKGGFKARTFKADSTRQYSIKITENLWLHRRYPKKIFEAIRKSPLNEKPGYVYSDLSFFLWPQITQRLSGMAFEAFLKTHFYSHLGASTLTFNPLRFYDQSRITPTELDTFFRKTLVHGRVHDEGSAMLGGVSGHAGLFGTANDLAKLMQMYLNGGSYGGEQLLKPDALAEFTRCQYPEQQIRRGLGFDRPAAVYNMKEHYIGRSASQQSFGHTGFTGTFTWADPANGLLVVFFANRVYPTRESRKLGELNLRSRFHQAVYEALEKH